MPYAPSFVRRLPPFPLLTGISAAIGLLVPTIYESTQNPAARSGHNALELAAIAILGLTFPACVFTNWLNRYQSRQPAVQTNSRKLQFRLLDVFVVVTLTAVVLGITRLLDAPLGSGLVTAVVAVILGWAFACDWQVRSRVGTLLVCMYLPLIWMFAFNEPIGHASGLLAYLPIGPVIYFAVTAPSLVNLANESIEYVACVTVILQLAMGVWLARRGGKLAVAYAIAMLASSSFNSLVMHALYRA